MAPRDIIRRRSIATPATVRAPETAVDEQLRTLVADPRYRHGEDFKRYVRRQHQRVFNRKLDSTGDADLGVRERGQVRRSLESFDRRREREHRSANDAVGAEREKAAGRRMPSSPGAPPARMTIFPPEERASEMLPSHPPRDLSHIRTGDILKSVDSMISAGRRLGLHHAAAHLQRYRDGTGGSVHLPWAVVRDAGYLARAEQRIFEHYENWFTGGLKDSRLGQPFLALRDGESIELGAPRKGELRNGLVWEADFGLRPIGSRIEQDLSLAIGEGKMQGFGQLRFSRVGNVINVRGTVDLQLAETYNFEPGFVAGLVNAFLVDGPDVGNGGLMELARRGVAAPFATNARQRVEVTGHIALDGDGNPDPARSDFVWRDLGS